MPVRTLVLVGTNKGAFIVESDEARRSWSLRGPFCEVWPIHHVIADPLDNTLYAAGGNRWVGVGVWRSPDLGQSWSWSGDGLQLDEADGPVKTVYSLAPAQRRLFAGVEPAGLFVSEDRGASWRHVEGLRAHPSRRHWHPGGGGLTLHSIVPHAHDDERIWVGISAAGVFATSDGGASWQPRNAGTRADFLPDEMRYPEFGQCVHCVVGAPGMPERLYQQNHCGMYRSDDGGRRWQSIEHGLPSSFGFPAAAHPRDPDTLYLVPLNGDEAGRYMPDAKAAVYRTRDAGATWQAMRDGLPQENAFLCVLRQAMATDRHDPAGVYVGTNSGTLFASIDEGERWFTLASHLPVITSLETLVVED